MPGNDWRQNEEALKRAGNASRAGDIQCRERTRRASCAGLQVVGSASAFAPLSCRHIDTPSSKECRGGNSGLGSPPGLLWFRIMAGKASRVIGTGKSLIGRSRRQGGGGNRKLRSRFPLAANLGKFRLDLSRGFRSGRLQGCVQGLKTFLRFSVALLDIENSPDATSSGDELRPRPDQHGKPIKAHTGRAISRRKKSGNYFRGLGGKTSPSVSHGKRSVPSIRESISGAHWGAVTAFARGASL